VLLKTLLLLFVLALGILYWQWVRRPPKSPRRTPRAVKSAERMVQCIQCGVHLPEGEAIGAEGQFYCCDEHLPQQRP
jgi:uncharacterized protein